MTELDNRVAITVQIQDITVTRPGFGILAIVHEHGVTAQPKVGTFTSLTDLLAVYPAYTPVGKCATIFYSQAFVAESIKVIKRDSGDSITTTMGEAILEDPDFYAFAIPGSDQTDIEDGAAWALANGPRMFFYSTGDSDAITTATTDPFSVIQALSNNRAAGWYSSTAGEEFDIDSLTVVGTTCTADVTTHGSVPVAVGDTVGIWDSTTSALNTTHTVTAIGANDFDFEVASGTSSDATTSTAWVNLNKIDSAISGKMLPLDAGSRTWDLQQLAGVTADTLTGTAMTNLGTKNANWFTTVGGLNVTGGAKTGGGGGKLASGRYIDVQRGADWLYVNLQADLFELMVAEGGSLGYDADGIQKVEQKIATRLDDGLDKGFLTPFVSGIYAGQNYNISMPNLGSITASDKTSRLLSGITINALIRGKIHNLEATLTLST